jgi:hypothetical protein
MSSDPTQPMHPPSKWSEQPASQWSAEPDEPQDVAPTRQEPAPGYRDQAATRQEQVPAFQDPGYQGAPGYQGTPGYQSAPGYQGGPNVRRPRRPRRMRRSVTAIFVLIVLAIVLLIGDRVANAVAENEMASQFTANGFPVKPSVTIEGFPFLTQLVGKDFKKVDISANSIPAGPVTINGLKATITGMHISGYSSSATATIDHVTATAFISFGSIASAGGLGDGTGLTMVPDGPDKLKITASIGGIASDSEEATIKQTGPQTITVHVLNSGSILSSVLSNFGDFSFSLPKGVPASLRITGLTLNSAGLTVKAAASHATFSQTKK